MKTLTTQGVAIPRLGLGTFGMEGALAQKAVERAIDAGYRHIDTAAMYANEDAVGAGIAASGIARKDIFVTTKVWHDSLAPDAVRRSFDTSLTKLGLDHVDLFLVHWPTPDMDLAATLEVLIDLKESGLTRAIGVCNFPQVLLRKAVEEVCAPIAVNQVEYHPFLSQDTLLGYMQPRGIALTAYSPVAKGTTSEDPVLSAIGRKQGVDGAQIALAWLLDQDGVIAIPKAASRENQKANLRAMDVVLDEEDRAAIAALPKNKRFVNPGFAPDWDAE
ncbi:aldo/keto reductase [Hwanghaeella sp.]|uniref:aldo/keto reductase n=1 Tax=Hwanghaeella sp. TaxID=2605943 RepID=UPI003CCBF415